MVCETGSISAHLEMYKMGGENLHSPPPQSPTLQCGKKIHYYLCIISHLMSRGVVGTIDSAVWWAGFQASSAQGKWAGLSGLTGSQRPSPSPRNASLLLVDLKRTLSYSAHPQAPLLIQQMCIKYL